MTAPADASSDLGRALLAFEPIERGLDASEGLLVILDVGEADPKGAAGLPPQHAGIDKIGI